MSILPCRRRRAALLALTLLAALLLGGCGAEPKKTEQLQIVVPNPQPEAETFQIPEGAAYIALPREAGFADYDAFDRAFEAALTARKSVICTSGHILPVEWPDLCEMEYGVFWVKSISYSKEWAIPEGESEKTTCYTYHFEYFDLPESDVEWMKREIDTEVGRILALFPENADEWTKARIVHDELVKTVSYDHEKDSVYYYNPYGALVQHEAVCQGYAAAFTFLMARAGSRSSFTASEDHGWNSLVMPQSREQYIDCTWDDPDLCDVYGQPYVFHDYFFLTREEVETVDSHSIATNDAYNTYDGELIPTNYFSHEGYMLSVFDPAALAGVYQRQLGKGRNLLEARFETEEEYRKALGLLENDCAGLNEVLSGAGYYGAFYYFTNDNIHTLSIGLDPAEA